MRAPVSFPDCYPFEIAVALFVNSAPALYVCDAAFALPIVSIDIGDEAVKLMGAASSMLPPHAAPRIACASFTSRVRRSPTLPALAGAGVMQKG